jgi:hypothetical protein
MIPVRMMEMAVDKIVNVIAVRHGFVATPHAVPVFGAMPTAAMLGCACARIGGAYRDDVLVDVIGMHVMKMSIMQVIDMAGMPNGGVAAIGAMLVSVVGMLGLATGGHRLVSLMLVPA